MKWELVLEYSNFLQIILKRNMKKQLFLVLKREEAIVLISYTNMHYQIGMKITII